MADYKAIMAAAIARLPAPCHISHAGPLSELGAHPLPRHPSASRTSDSIGSGVVNPDGHLFENLDQMDAMPLRQAAALSTSLERSPAA